MHFFTQFNEHFHKGQDFDPRSAESALLQTLWLEQLVAGLEEQDRRIIELFLAGDPVEEFGGHYAVQRIGHRMAVLGQVERRCPSCERTLPAERFGWDAPDCLACETKSRRWRRAKCEKWLEHIAAGAHAYCPHCGDWKPMQDFAAKNLSSCRACTSAAKREATCRTVSL
jgi:uncharacterized protein (DUF983 family)